MTHSDPKDVNSLVNGVNVQNKFPPSKGVLLDKSQVSNCTEQHLGKNKLTFALPIYQFISTLTRCKLTFVITDGVDTLVIVSTHPPPSRTFINISKKIKNISKCDYHQHHLVTSSILGVNLENSFKCKKPSQKENVYVWSSTGGTIKRLAWN